MDDSYSFGAWLRRRRKACDLTQADLARQIGVAAITIQKIEADERRPSRQVAELLADQLQIPHPEREAFLAVARGEQAVDHLPPVASASVDRVPNPTAVRPGTRTAPDLPSGTVTFLFTDIEGSTRLWEQHPQVMPAALSRHDAILRQVIESHDGHVFKTMGDACCAAFASAPDALAAVIAGQRAVVSEAWGTVGPIRVRMALHTGTAEPQYGDYLGQPLNRVARLLAAGHGGQILLSAASMELVRDQLPAGVSLRDLGSHRLKDLVRAEPLFQISVPDLPADFPPLKSLNPRSTNLPIQVNELIGRTREVMEVIDLLDRARLVMLIGPGGTGKTRLALQLGSELLDQYADGVWFVDLSPVSDPEQIATAIAQVLGIPESPERPIRAGLLRWLRERQVLLILDNCEQVIAGAADLVAELLRSADRLTILATSRIPLRIAAEQEYAVAPLGLPDPGVLPPLDQLSQYDAVALFIARAHAVRADFTITTTNAPAVAEICVRLDGLPLAIELAAARLRLFPPDQLLSRLIAARMQTLTGGARDLPVRQQTIRAAIAWSYHLLSAPQQTLLARLAVFVGGWTLDAAEVVCADSQVDVIEGMDALVEHNLVRIRETDGEPQYSMLETIREYALERLQERDEIALMRQRHAECFVQLAETAELKLRSAEQIAWLERLDADHPNLQAALEWCLAVPDTTDPRRILGWRISAALWGYWDVRGLNRDWQRWIGDQVGSATAAPTELRGRLCLGAAILIDYRIEQERAAHLFEQSLALFQSIGATWWSTFAQKHYWWWAGVRDEDRERAEEIIAERAALARQTNDPWLIAEMQIMCGRTLMGLGKAELAIPYLQQSLALARAIGTSIQITDALYILGRCSLNASSFDTAQAYFRECLALWRTIRPPYVAVGLFGLGEVAYYTGDVETNRVLQQERLLIEQGLDNTIGVSSVLLAFAAIEWSVGNLVQAETYTTQSLALARTINSQIAIVNVLLIDADIALARDALDQVVAICHDIAERTQPTHENVGIARSAIQRFLGRVALRRNEHASARAAFAQSFMIDPFAHTPARIIQHLMDVAEVLSAEGQHLAATRLWGATEAIRERIGTSIFPVDRPRHERLAAAAQAQCVSAAWDAAWMAGRALSQEHAATEALAWLKGQPETQEPAQSAFRMRN